jgi:hypothetical protein
MQVFSHIAEPGAEFVQTTSSSGNIEVNSLVLPDGRVGMLIANLNSQGSSTVDVNISGVSLDISGTKWLYGQSQTTPLETSLATGLGNSFSVSVPFRSIVALLIDATLPGDFNRDGVVDSADFIYWQKTGGSADDYLVWQQNFGRTDGSGAGAGGSVPEPASSLMFVLFGLAGFIRARIPRRHNLLRCSTRCQRCV